MLKFIKVIDHPEKRYPVGSLVTVERGSLFGDDAGSYNDAGDRFLILGYVVSTAENTRYRDPLFDNMNHSPTIQVFEVIGLMDGRLVRTPKLETAGKLLRYFTMIADIRDAIDG